MEIVLKDRDQNDILSPTLTQWDQGVIIMIRDFLYPTGEQHPYLHFYNTTKQHFYAIGDQTEGNQLVVDTTNHTLTCRIPNQLLTEPYPITVHVYLTSGGSVIDNNTSVEARTVYTATIGVEPRMRPDGIIDEDDNGGEVSAQYLRDLLGASIDEWEHNLNAFYGSAPTPESVTCYYNPLDQKMYSAKSSDTYTGEITGDSGKFYQDAETDTLYLYENSRWVEWSVSGTLVYAKERADACDQAKSDMEEYYTDALDASVEHLSDVLMQGLGGCVVRVASSTPTGTTYSSVQTDIATALGNDSDLLGKPVITFVIGA